MSGELCFILCAAAITWVQGAGRPVCPESKKPYPGDCRLFYKCVPTPASAHAYVWVLSRCTAGMIFEAKLQSCVMPQGGRPCPRPQKETEGNSHGSLKGGIGAEGGLEMTDYPAASGPKGGENNALNALDADSVPLSAVNNPEADSIIGAQMHRLTQLISSLKATSTSLHNNHPGSPWKRPHFPVEYSALGRPSFQFKQDEPPEQLNPLPAQIYKIMAQLISQTPDVRQTNLKLTGTHAEYPGSNLKRHNNYGSPEKIVKDLYRKYLKSGSFLKQGEFVKTADKNDVLANRHKTTVLSPAPYPNQDRCSIGERLPNPSDCTKYYICRNGVAKTGLDCPSKTAFDKIKKKCNPYEYKKCMLGRENCRNLDGHEGCEEGADKNE